MQSTASEPNQPSGPRYGFSFAWDSPYGHIVRLLESLELKPGLIVDLGCGQATVADQLRERGYQYVGADIDSESVRQLSHRGFEAHEVDLRHTSEIASRIVEIVDGRRVAAVLLLDVIEHLPETRSFLSAIRDTLDRLGQPPLLVSVPNVSHVDVAAKLVFGRWEYTATGLLDQTHLQFFTSERLRGEARACGLLEIGADDFHLAVSDQRFPVDHPALSPHSPIAQALRLWRETADPHGQTVQFIRAFIACESDGGSATSIRSTQNNESFLTVVMRTQGTRPTHLREALTCLAAQTFDDFRVLVMVHTEHSEPAMSTTKTIVEEFHPTFASRVEVIHVAGGSRGRPLNVALDRLRSTYVAFLDDDDLVTANWVEVFAKAAGGGAIIRSVAAVRHVSKPEESHSVPYTTESALEFRYSPRFDPVHHLWGNDTPICTFAVPRTLIEFLEVRFDENLPVLEDWDFLVRCVSFAPVRDTREVTSIYQMWRNGESSASLHDISLWQAMQRVLQERSNQKPLVFPAGTASLLIDMCQQLAQLPAELDVARRETIAAREEARKQAEEVHRLGHEVGVIHNKYLVTIGSLRWRILGLPARGAASLRKVRRWFGWRKRESSASQRHKAI